MILLVFERGGELPTYGELGKFAASFRLPKIERLSASGEC